jgi:hypothetical protein
LPPAPHPCYRSNAIVSGLARVEAAGAAFPGTIDADLLAALSEPDAGNPDLLLQARLQDVVDAGGAREALHAALEVRAPASPFIEGVVMVVYATPHAA